MNQIRIRATFDFIDPGSYLVHELLGRWVADDDRTLSASFHPLELRAPSSPPLDPGIPQWRTLTDAMAALAEREGIPFDPPDFVPWTRKAHELTFHAGEKGQSEASRDALFRAYFVDGLDIGRVDVLVELAEALGLEASETRTVLGVDRFLPHVEEARREARSRGIRGVPTLEIGGRRLEGLRTIEEFRTFVYVEDDDMPAEDH